jgi:hypothetical protein
LKNLLSFKDSAIEFRQLNVLMPSTSLERSTPRLSTTTVLPDLFPP